jgi:hypothetical protein
MKIICVKGGLGNQMFEYCRFRDLHDRERSVYLHYVHRLLKDHGGVKLYETFDLPTYPEPIGVYALSLVLKMCLKLDILPQYCDDYYSSSLLIDDYSQHQRYISFAKVYFRFRKEIRQAGAKYEALIEQALYPVAVHIRRGDYLKPENLSNFGVCSRNYFIRAMHIIRQQHPNAQFFIFSDDMDWARRNITIQNVVFVENHGEMPDGTEMYLMTLCHGHIISNSTFSFWGAYLGSHVDAVNIYPKRWFREQTWGAPEIFPPEWIGIAE